MPRHSNTLAELFKTAQKGGPSQIFCPRCGTPMTLRRPGGARPVLGERTRESLNVHLSCFRYGWLTWIADSLSQKNDGVEPRAPIPDVTIDKTRVGTLAGDLDDADWYYVIAEGRRKHNGYEKIGTLIDLLSPGDIRKEILEKVRKIYELPPLSASGTLDQDQMGNSTAEHIAAIIQFVLLPIEKSDLFVATLNIVLEEPRVSQWIQQVRRDAQNKFMQVQRDAEAGPNAGDCSEQPITHGGIEVNPVDVIASLSELCPPRYQYLMSYLRLLAAALNDSKYFNDDLVGKLDIECRKGDGDRELEPEDVRARLINRCERAACLVGLMYMHITVSGREEMRKHFSPLGRLPSGNGEYRLPETTAITYDAARLLMQSMEVSVADILGIGGKYLEILNTMQRAPESNVPENSHEWFLRVIEEPQINELFCGVFGFGCQGPPPQFPVFKGHQSHPSSTGMRDGDVADVCGWTPKAEETCSILLIGSPGCGKSNAFVSGMARLAAAFARGSGFSNTFSARSDMLVDRVMTAFYAGREPVRTEISTYHSVEFSLLEEGGSRKLHFVIDDVAGEQATQRLREGESSTIVRQTLRSADVVVAFLDISIDPELATKIEVGPQRDKLSALIGCREKARRERADEISKDTGGSTSVADVSQFQFINSIIAECKRDRTQEEMPDLILVIPKVDLYAAPDEPMDSVDAEGESSPYIMHNVFLKAKERKTLYPDKVDGGAESNKPKWLTSSGVRYKHNGDDGAPIEGYVKAVEAEMQKLSDDCYEALMRVGQLVDADATSGEAAIICNDQMDALISRLRREFKSVHLLPVSAQGKPADMEGGGQCLEEVPERENDSELPNERGHGDQEPPAVLVEVPRPTGDELRRKLGHPQKFSEFLILGPAMMLVRKHWIKPDVDARTQRTPQISPAAAATGNASDLQRSDGQSRRPGTRSSADGNSAARQPTTGSTNRPN